MPQAGIHSLAGIATRKWVPDRAWLMLGIVLGNPLPDIDNFAVAIATLGGLSTEGLHRTFTHSIFIIAAIIAVFYLVAKIRKQPRLGNLGLGLGIGMIMHILLDLGGWFNGVYLLWPLPIEVNFWSGFIPPEWWTQLMLPTEFLFFALFFIYLASIARKHGTDHEYLPKLRKWTITQGVLFVVFTVLVYTLEKGFTIPYGALYLFSLGLTYGIIIRMRNTIEAIA